MTVHPTWHNDIETDESFSALNDKAAAIISAVGKGVSSNNLWSIIKNNPGSAILFKNGPDAVAVAHHLTALGGSIAIPGRSIVGIIGKDLVSACGISFNRSRKSSS